MCNEKNSVGRFLDCVAYSGIVTAVSSPHLDLGPVYEGHSRVLLIGTAAAALLSTVCVLGLPHFHYWGLCTSCVLGLSPCHHRSQHVTFPLFHFRFVSGCFLERTTLVPSGRAGLFITFSELRTGPVRKAPIAAIISELEGSQLIQLRQGVVYVMYKLLIWLASSERDRTLQSFIAQAPQIFHKLPSDLKIKTQGLESGWMSVLKAGQRFLALYRLCDIHIKVDIHEFGAIGEGYF